MEDDSEFDRFSWYRRHGCGSDSISSSSSGDGKGAVAIADRVDTATVTAEEKELGTAEPALKRALVTAAVTSVTAAEAGAGAGTSARVLAAPSPSAVPRVLFRLDDEAAFHQLAADDRVRQSDLRTKTSTNSSSSSSNSSNNSSCVVTSSGGGKGIGGKRSLVPKSNCYNINPSSFQQQQQRPLPLQQVAGDNGVEEKEFAEGKDDDAMTHDGGEKKA